jgi:DNA-directed RNA polymerase specialized sigma24 family protein
MVVLLRLDPMSSFIFTHFLSSILHFDRSFFENHVSHSSAKECSAPIADGMTNIDKSSNDEIPSRRRTFVTTRWTLVRSAGASVDEDQSKHLDRLLRIYLPALREFLESKFRIPPDQADDLLQTFALKKILLQSLLSHAEPAKGKFRTFLLNAITNFAISELRKQSARKRAHNESAISLDEVAELETLQDSSRGFRYDFDNAFTQQTLREALRRMKQRCERKGRFDSWEVFDSRIVRPVYEAIDPEPYESLVQRLRLDSSTKAMNLLMAGKRTFTTILREVVDEYAVDSQDASGELRHLRSLLQVD